MFTSRDDKKLPPPQELPNDEHLPEVAPLTSPEVVRSYLPERYIEDGLEKVELPAEYSSELAPQRYIEDGLEVKAPPRRAFFDRFYARRVASESSLRTARETPRTLDPVTKKKWLLIGGLVVAIIVIGLAVGLSVGLVLRDRDNAPSPTPTPSESLEYNVECPRTNGSIISSGGQTFMKLCDIDWPAGQPAQDPLGPNNGTVQDIQNSHGNGATGIVVNTFQACVDACSSYNAARGGQSCFGATYVGSKAIVDQGMRNCYLKSAVPEDATGSTDQLATAKLL